MEDVSDVDDVSALRAEIETLTADREHYRELYLKALEQCRKLELGIVGAKSEKLGGEAQLTMAVLETLLGRAATPAPAPAREVVREHTRAKPTGRKPLPEHLPRVEIELVPPEVERAGRDAFEQI